MRSDSAVTLTRRALASRLGWAAAAIGLGPAATAQAAARPLAQPALPDPALRDAALRGLALAAHRGDPVAAAAADAALAQLADTDPEAAVLGQLYRLLDVRPAAWWPSNAPAAATVDLASLHAAIHACQPVAFGYTDLDGNLSERTVMPLALVHPPQGVKLLAWCAVRADFRQFFVRAMQGLAPQPGDFRENRLTLLQGLLAKESRSG
jgi:predicted DNA-binding transcriptional regulator YafY